MDLIYLLLFISGISYSSYGFFEKYYLLKYIDTLNIIFFRNIFISIILLSYTLIYYLYNKKKIINIKSKLDNKFYLIFTLYSIFYLFTIFIMFKGLEIIPANKVLLTTQISMVIGSCVLGYFVFKENFSTYNLLGVIFALLGLFFIICL